jgi:hypothetical protein
MVGIAFGVVERAKPDTFARFDRPLFAGGGTDAAVPPVKLEILCRS